MTSKRSLKSDDVDGFMLAFWDNFQDLEEDYGVRIGVRVTPRPTRGHVMFLAVACEVGPEAPTDPVAVAEALWPTHYATSLHALLYALLVRLWRELDVWRDGERLKNSTPPSAEAAE